MGEGVTVNISRYPREPKDQAVKQNGLRYYYDSDNGTVLLTDGWYPDPDGTYMKLTHTPKGGSIKEILHNGKPLSGFEDQLNTHSSVSVYYWLLDNECEKPLLIQLGSGNEYYKYANSNTWKKEDMTADELKEKLDKQNCKRNDAYIINISEISGSYRCYGCPKKAIQVSSGTLSGYIYSSHYITDSRSQFSVSGFKDGSNRHVGLPSIKGVNSVTIFWTELGGIPLLIAHQKGWHNYFRRNTSSSNTWSEVSRNDRPTGPSDEDGNMRKLLQCNDYYPSITLDLSTSVREYSDTITGILITVQIGTIDGGYHTFEHSLKGGVFELDKMKNKSNILTGIDSSDPLVSVTAYYLGQDPSDEKKLLLVELKRFDKAYKYFYKQNKKNTDWTKLSIPEGETTRLLDDKLKTELYKLKKELFSDTPDPSPVAPSQSSEAKDYSSVPEKSTSPVGPAIGGTVCALVTLVAMVLLVKFWPKVRTRFVGIRNGFGIHKKGELNM